jgi:predicted dienelactone hydrolase
MRAPDQQRVVVIGHSWGATTALQLAGVRPTDSDLRRRCTDLNDPERNLSWTLQCSWRNGASEAGISDPRVIAVAAVSPPVSLLFPRGSGVDLQARVLLVSGSRDWVVPPDPEAVVPMQLGRHRGNQLVLAEGGDHFNLRPGAAADGGVLGALLLRWTAAAFQAGPAVRPAAAAPPLLPPGGWGSAAMPLIDATPGL